MWDYRNLDVWRRSIDLIKIVYDVTRSFPKEEMWALSSQLKRAVVSISANIAEGCGRRTSKDYISFLHNAMGSVKEVESELFAAEKLGYVDRDKLNELLKELGEIGRMISGVIEYVSVKDVK